MATIVWRKAIAAVVLVVTVELSAAADETKTLADAARLEAQAGRETAAGQYAAAARHADEAAAIYARQGDGRRQSVALNSAGLSALYAAEYGAAERNFRAAIALSTSGGDDAGRAEQVTNLGNVFFFLGRYADAAQAYDEALRATEKHRNQPWAARRMRIIQVNKATLSQRLGRDEQALEIYRAIEGGAGDLRPREQAQLVGNMGVLFRRLGDPVKALAAYDHALDLFARDPQVDGELGVLNNRGIVLALDLGDLPAAARTFSDALMRATRAGNLRERLHAQLYRGETRRRAGFLEDARVDFETSLAAARELATPEEEWKALWGLARIETALECSEHAIAHLERAVAVIESIREAVRVPSLKSDFFNDKREVYDALIRARLVAAAPAADIFELVERSHSRGWRDRIGLTVPVDLASVQRVLPAGVLLLDYWSAPDGAARISVTRDAVHVDRVTASDAAVRRLLEAIAQEPPTDWRAAAAAIAPSLLPPVLPPGTVQVIVVPDGVLSNLPFELLPVGPQLLVEHAAVSYAPTAALLFRIPPRQPLVRWPWAAELQAFADPVFTSADLDDRRSGPRRLPASADEVRGIAAELAGRSMLHIGADNRKTYLFDADRGAPILHVASHAMASAEAMEGSRILFSSAGPGGDADYLFLKEAYDLPLNRVELAVLSACETERGRVLRGEGVQSFSRAFLAAGAQTTVTALWRVADGPTAAFMKLFYHHLQRGLSRGEALRQTKLRFLRDASTVSDPQYWAAFVLTGEAFRPIPRPIQWRTLAACAFVCGLVVIAGWRRFSGL
jgi:tetratricopeptide (TPR) repeat protein